MYKKILVPLDGSELAEYISRTTFKGAFGEISFDQNGDVSKAPYVVWQVTDGAFKQLK